MAKSGFYLGKLFNLAEDKLLTDPVLFDPADLTTHAVVTGMTGSGKTGLCIGLLEEAALAGYPAIMIDPKGDLTNLLLHFPELQPADFEPWLDPAEAQRQGKSVTDLAVETASRWQKGLADWGLGREQLLALQDAVQYTVFSPGSTAARPVNILSSFRQPDLSWEENKEILREKIASIVTALLALVGENDLDPLRSRPHILVSNILEHAWSAGHTLDLTELILQVQKPPFDRLGAFPLDSFYPEKDRNNLAITLNNFLASPSFQTWLEGENLDVQKLLYTAEGKPRHSIFYLAHLNDNERMFFVTLLYAAIESWMRAQRGTSGLRALVYFDEILGYLPPLGNPPSKPIMLRMLKQARAFGVGMLLATQNPVDLDYKGLSNTGTWFIGRLQTDQDKERLLDGLQTVSGGMNRREVDKLISSLKKRIFLLHSVHAPAPRVFSSRWALNFLAGPLTRAQLPLLKSLAQPEPTTGTQPVSAAAEPITRPRGAAAAAQPAVSPTPTTGVFSQTRPAVPRELEEYFLPTDLGISQALGNLRSEPGRPLEAEGILYRPALLCQLELRYYNRRYNIDLTRKVASLLPYLDPGIINWENFAWRTYNSGELALQPLPQARFAQLPGWLNDPRRVVTLKKDVVDWAYRTGTIRLRANEALKVYAGPEVSTAEFREQCSAAARQALQAEWEKALAPIDRKIVAVQQRISRQEMEVQEHKDNVEKRRLEQLGAGGEFLLGMFGGRKRSVSSTLSKSRMAQKAKSDAAQEEKELKDLQAQEAALLREREAVIRSAQDKWAQAVNDVIEIPLAILRKDIFLTMFGVAWLPHYLVRVGGEVQEFAAYQPPPK